MKITQRQLRQIIREELTKSLKEIDLADFPGQKDKARSIVSPGTKVRHKKTRLLYTVEDMKDQQVFLVSPEGEEFGVSKSDFGKEYDLD